MRRHAWCVYGVRVSSASNDDFAGSCHVCASMDKFYVSNVFVTNVS